MWYNYYWEPCYNSKVLHIHSFQKKEAGRERSIILQINELKFKKTWLEAYSYLHFIDLNNSLRLRMRTDATEAFILQINELKSKKT